MWKVGVRFADTKGYAYSREEPRGKASDVSRAYIEGWELIGETR